MAASLPRGHCLLVPTRSIEYGVYSNEKVSANGNEDWYMWSSTLGNNKGEAESGRTLNNNALGKLQYY